MMNEGLLGAIKYLVETGREKYIKEEINGGIYTNENLRRVETPRANAIETTTLTSIVDYIKENVDGAKDICLIVHVEDYKRVSIKTELNNDRNRECLMVAQALTPNITTDRFLDAERFNIMLQSSFVENIDRAKLLKVSGCIKEEAIKSIGDDGVSQAATIKTGVASVNDVKVPNPVILAPYRTFPEIEQPISKFIFRMQSGPDCALFEADGGAWRNEAMARIKVYLEEELKEFEDIKIIS